MIKTKLDSSTELSFELKVEGSEVTPRSRLVLGLKDGQFLSLTGKVYEDRVTVNIPPLVSIKEMIEGTTLNAQLEVFINENYFIPWEGQISIEQPVVVKAEAVSAEVKQEPIREIKVNVTQKSDSVEPKQKERQSTIVQPKVQPKRKEVEVVGEKVTIKSDYVNLHNGSSMYDSIILEEGDTIKVIERKNVTEALLNKIKEHRAKFIEIKKDIEFPSDDVVLEKGDYIELL